LIVTLTQGLTLCFPMSFIVLLCATENWRISVFGILTIMLIVGNVLGFFKFVLNWALGIAESIAGVIVIGFSIDYCLHMSVMILEADAAGLKRRDLKTQYALETIGETILGAGLVTFACGFAMFFCQATLFNKMALMICLTIILSVVYTLCFFTGLMLLIGPEHDQGSLERIFDVLRCRKREKTYKIGDATDQANGHSGKRDTTLKTGGAAAAAGGESETNVAVGNERDG